MNLRYCLQTAHIDCGITEHPQRQMQKLEITVQHSTPQSIGDQWWFWNCENVPDPLPSYLTLLDVLPHDCIGFGLSKENADKIANYKAAAEVKV